MKILTLNTHSLIEEDYEGKTDAFVARILQERPEVFALQEVNQRLSAEILPKLPDCGYVPCPSYGGPVRRDNHALRVAEKLAAAGLPYYWTWVPAKIGYQVYAEGLAMFSREPISAAKELYVSGIQNKKNWKTRKMVGIRPGKERHEWFYTVHLGWWDDEEEPFSAQWSRVIHEVRTRQEEEYLATGVRPRAWVMGDFNSPAEVRGEGYDLVSSSGWHDTFCMAEKRDDGMTVDHVIDGWRDKVSGSLTGMRIDQIWCDRPVRVQSSSVVFDGENGPAVSDHFGVLIETE